MLVTSPVTNVESMHRHPSGLPSLGQLHLFMATLYHSGMHITTIVLLLKILRHLVDGKLPGQNNLLGLRLFVQWGLIKIMYQTLESNIKLKSINFSAFK